MINKNIEKIVLELVELGYSERKIINRLKDIKEELIREDNAELFDDKKFNKLINGIVFGGSFYIESPTQPLLGLIKNIKKMYGSEFTYFLLYNILTNGYFNNQIHDKYDNDKCNWLMYLIKENINKYIPIFKEINRQCEEPV